MFAPRQATSKQPVLAYGVHVEGVAPVPTSREELITADVVSTLALGLEIDLSHASASATIAKQGLRIPHHCVRVLNRGAPHQMPWHGISPPGHPGNGSLARADVGGELEIIHAVVVVARHRIDPQATLRKCSPDLAHVGPARQSLVRVDDGVP